jgi:hypothetical protein
MAVASSATSETLTARMPRSDGQGCIHRGLLRVMRMRDERYSSTSRAARPARAHIHVFPRDCAREWLSSILLFLSDFYSSQDQCYPVLAAIVNQRDGLPFQRFFIQGEFCLLLVFIPIVFHADVIGRSAKAIE